MKGMLVLAEIYVDVLESSHLLDYFLSLQSQRLPGLVTLDLWKPPSQPGQYLMTSLYAHEADGNAALEWVAEHPLIDQLKSRESVPNVVVGNVVSAFTPKADRPYMSLVNAWASSGYGAEKAEEIRNIVEDLAYVDGYRGHVLAENQASKEQFISIVYWADAASFHAAMPTAPGHNVEVYERVAVPAVS